MEDDPEQSPAARWHMAQLRFIRRYPFVYIIPWGLLVFVEARTSLGQAPAVSVAAGVVVSVVSFVIWMLSLRESEKSERDAH